MKMLGWTILMFSLGPWVTITMHRKLPPLESHATVLFGFWTRNSSQVDYFSPEASSSFRFFTAVYGNCVVQSKLLSLFFLTAVYGNCVVKRKLVSLFWCHAALSHHPSSVWSPKRLVSIQLTVIHLHKSDHLGVLESKIHKPIKLHKPIKQVKMIANVSNFPWIAFSSCCRIRLVLVSYFLYLYSRVAKLSISPVTKLCLSSLKLLSRHARWDFPLR